MDEDDHDPSAWIYETLGRPAMNIGETTDQSWLDREIRERLEALLAAYGMDPTPEGWRDFALALARKYEPCMQIRTPVDREESLGGRPLTMKKFIQKSQVKELVRRGKARPEAIRAVAKAHGMNPKTLSNVISEPTPLPPEMARRKYEWPVDRAIRKAADDISR